MRFVGQTEVYAALAACPEQGDALRAWTAEVKYRTWRSAAELAADFRNVDVSKPPAVVFYLVPTLLRIETLIDFRLGVMLVTAVRPSEATAIRRSETCGARRDN